MVKKSQLKSKYMFCGLDHCVIRTFYVINNSLHSPWLSCFDIITFNKSVCHTKIVLVGFLKLILICNPINELKTVHF